MDLKARINNFINLFKTPKLQMVIFFVTSYCNSKCSTCFYWKNLNSNKDLSLNKIDEISKKLGLFKILGLSGGEPFLRNDLPELINIFIKNNQIESVAIPTNGLLTNQTKELTEKILQLNPKLNVSINFSIDGLEETHNKIRGIKDNFNITLKTINSISVLRKKYPNLNVNVNSVICKENYKELLKLTEFIKNNLNVNGHFFEIIRGDSKNSDLKKVPVNDLKNIYDSLFPIQIDYFEKNLKEQNFGKGIKGSLRKFIRRKEYYRALSFQYKTQFNNYAYKKSWRTHCLAGQTIKVLRSDGLIQDCELRKKRGKNCDCTHVCFIINSYQYSLKRIFI